jgi:hypothetical protein
MVWRVVLAVAVSCRHRVILMAWRGGSQVADVGGLQGQVSARPWPVAGDTASRYLPLGWALTGSSGWLRFTTACNGRSCR